MFLKMPILNKIQNVYRASRKLRPGMRIFERCKSSRLPPRFVNSRRDVTGGDILKDDYQKDLASDAKIHSKLRIEEPETGLILDVNLKYSFRKIPGNLPALEGDLEGDSKSKNIKNQPEHVWYDFIPDVDPDVLDVNRQFMLAERTNNPSMVSKSRVVTRKLSGSSLSSRKSHRQVKKSGRKSTADKYKAKVSGKIDITSPHFNSQQFSEALHGVVQTVMANSFHTMLQKVSEDQMQDRARYIVTRTFNPSKRRLSLKSSRSTSSGVSRKKYGNPSAGSTESKNTKETWEKKNVTTKKSKETLKTVAEISNTKINANLKKDQPLKSSVLKSEESSIGISRKNTFKEVEPTKTSESGSDTFMQDFNCHKKFINESFALASTHINPSTACTYARKQKIPADEIPPFYHIVLKLKEHEESKSKSQDENVKSSVDNTDSHQTGIIHNSARETKSDLRSDDGAHSNAPFLFDRIVFNTSDKSKTVDSVKFSKLNSKGVNPPSKKSTTSTTGNLDQAVQEFRALYANFINSVKTGNNQKPDCGEGQCSRNSPKFAPSSKSPSSQGKLSCGQIDEGTAKEITATILKNLQDSMTDEIRAKISPDAIQKKALKQQEDTSILKATEKELQKAIQSDCSKSEVQTKGSTELRNKNSNIKDTNGVQNKDLSPSSKATCQNGPPQKKDNVADTKSHSVTKKPTDEKADDSKNWFDCNKFRVVADQTTKVLPTTPNCQNQGTNPTSLSNAPGNTQNIEARCTRDNAKPTPKSSAKDCLQSSEKAAGFSTCEKQVPQTKLTRNQTGLGSPAKNCMSFKMGEPIVEIRPVSHTFNKFEKASSLPSDCSKFKVLKVNKTDSPISLEKTSPDPDCGTSPKSSDKTRSIGMPNKSKQKGMSHSDPLVSPKQHENNVKENVPRGKAGQESCSSVTGGIEKAKSQPEKSVKPRESLPKSVKPKKLAPQEGQKESSPVDCSKYDTNEVTSINKSRKVAGKDGQNLREKDAEVKTEQGSCATAKEKPVDKIKRGTTEVLSKDESKTAIKSKSQSKEKLNDLKRSKSNECNEPKKSHVPEDKTPSKIPVQACSMAANTAAKTMSNLSSKQAAQLAAIDCSKFKTSESCISKSVSNSENKNKADTKPSDCSGVGNTSESLEKASNQSTKQNAAIDCSKFKSSETFISKSVTNSESKNKIDNKSLDCSETVSSTKPPDKTNNQSNTGNAIDCSNYVSDKKLDSLKQSDGKGGTNIDCSKYITLDKPSKIDSAAKTACTDAKPVQKDSKLTLTSSDKTNKTEQKGFEPIDCSKYKSVTSASKPEPKLAKQSDCPGSKSTAVEGKSPVETGKTKPIDCSKYITLDKPSKIDSAAKTSCTDAKPVQKDLKPTLTSCDKTNKTEQKGFEPIDCSKYKSVTSGSKPEPKLPKQSDCPGNKSTAIEGKSPVETGKTKPIDCSKYITLDKPPKIDSSAKTACTDAKPVQKDLKPTLTSCDKTNKSEEKGFEPIDCSKYKSVTSASNPEPKLAKQSDCPGSKFTAVEGKSPVETGKTKPIDCSKYKTDRLKTTDKTDSSHCGGSGDCCKAEGSNKKSGDCCTPDGSCKKSPEGCKAGGSCEKSGDCCKAGGSNKKSGDCCTPDGSCKKSNEGCKAGASCEKSGDCCKAGGPCEKSGDCNGGAADCCKVSGAGGGPIDSNVRTYGTQPKKDMVIDCDAWNRRGTCLNGKVKPRESPKSGDLAKHDPPVKGDHCFEPPQPDKPISQKQSHKSTINERLKTIDCSKYRDSFKSDSTVSCKYEITPTSATFPVQTGSHTPRTDRVETGQHKTSEQSKSSNTNSNEQVETKKSVSETAIRTCSNTLNETTILKRTSTEPNDNPIDVKSKESKITHPVETKRFSSDVHPKPCSNPSNETSAPSSETPVETKESKITQPVETKRSSSELTVKPCSNALNVSSVLKKTSNECSQTPVEVKSKKLNANEAVETKKSTSETRIRPCSSVLDAASKLETAKQPYGKSLEDTSSCMRKKGSRVEIKPYKPPNNRDDSKRSAPQDEKKRQSKIPSLFRKSQKPDKDTQAMNGKGNKHENRTPKSVGFQSVSSKPSTCRPVMCAKQKLEPTPACRPTPAMKADVAKRIQVESTPAPFNCCLKVTGKKKVEVVNCPMPTLCDDSVIIKMHSVGLCCSDVYMFENGIQKIETADISLGHEGAGEIFEVGPKVKSLKRGDRVCIEAGVPCARCKYCKEGRYNICPNMHFSGLLSTYCCHPASLCHKIPDSMTYEEAALVHPLSLGLQACHHGKVSIGSKVLILGACPLGLSALMAARAMGADKIIIVDILQKNLDVASELCADLALVAAQSMTSKDLCKEILSKTKCRPNVVIDCCGCSKTVNMAVDLVEQGGSFVLAGCQAECVTLPTLTTLAKELCFYTSFRSSNMFPSAINLIKTGRACVTKMITHRTEFCSTQGGFEIALQDTENCAIKVMVNWPHKNASEK